MMNALSGGNNFANISSFVASNARVVQNSLISIAAGQRIMRPADGIADYFSARSMNSQIRGLEHAKRGLFQARTIVSLAEESVAMVFGDLEEILDSAREYFATNNEDMKRHYLNRINELKGLVVQTIENTVFNDKQLLKANLVPALKDKDGNVVRNSYIAPLFEVMIDPNNVNNRMTIIFGNEVVFDSDDIGNMFSETDQKASIENIQAQINRAARFMGAIKGLKTGIDAQININEISAEQMSNSTKNALGLDDMDGIFDLTKRQIQQQAAVSMLTQGNMMRGGVLNLIKFA